jgi:Uma2 family endonuclease
MELADLLHALGDLPPRRVRLNPTPGRATVADLDYPTNALCELIDGTLVEKAHGFMESVLTGWVVTLLNGYIFPRNLGIVTGATGFTQLASGNYRSPSVAYFSWDTLPDRRLSTEAYPRLAPDLAVEMLCLDNTPGEMQRKRTEFFASGTSLIWEIDPRARSARAYTAVDVFTDLTVTDTLDADPVLPGFTISLADLFAYLDRHG